MNTQAPTQHGTDDTDLSRLLDAYPPSAETETTNGEPVYINCTIADYPVVGIEASLESGTVSFAIDSAFLADALYRVRAFLPIAPEGATIRLQTQPRVVCWAAGQCPNCGAPDPLTQRETER